MSGMEALISLFLLRFFLFMGPLGENCLGEDLNGDFCVLNCLKSLRDVQLIAFSTNKFTAIPSFYFSIPHISEFVHIL